MLSHSAKKVKITMLRAQKLNLTKVQMKLNLTAVAAFHPEVRKLCLSIARSVHTSKRVERVR